MPIQQRVGIIKPTAAAFTTSSTGTATGTKTHTSDGNAYDASTATAAVLSVAMTTPVTASGSQSQIATYTTFGTGYMVCQLNVICDCSVTENAGGAGSFSSVLLEYSINGGGAWFTFASNASSGPNWANTTLSHAFTSLLDISQLQVRATVTGQSSFVDASHKSNCDGSLTIYDIAIS